uniref:MARVEL domain-containing protein n=1 Tax=Phytophthora ramorum TaxID=164328 RepID=H3HBC3_PHYRM
MRWGRTLLRFLQFALALVALATISRAFVGASYYGYSSMLGSSAATYTQLVTYTSMLVGLFLFLFVELLRYFKRPTPRIVEQLMDLVLAAMLVVAGIVLVVSDYVAHCSVYGYMLRCNLLKTAVVFSFLTAAAHLASFLLSSCEDYGSKRERTGSHSDYDTRPSSMCLLCTRVLLRFIQFCSSLVAYVALQTACVTSQRTAGSRSVGVVVRSGAVNFAMVINFLAFVYAFAFLIFIEWLRMCNRPVHLCEKVLDFVALVCLTVATLVLLLSDISLHCRGNYGRFLHCGGLYLAIAMSFLSMGSFLSIVLLECPRAGATPVPVITAQPPQRAPPAST